MFPASFAPHRTVVPVAGVAIALLGAVWCVGTAPAVPSGSSGAGSALLCWLACLGIESAAADRAGCCSAAKPRRLDVAVVVDRCVLVVPSLLGRRGVLQLPPPAA